MIHIHPGVQAVKNQFHCDELELVVSEYLDAQRKWLSVLSTLWRHRLSNPAYIYSHCGYILIEEEWTRV